MIFSENHCNQSKFPVFNDIEDPLPVPVCLYGSIENINIIPLINESHLINNDHVITSTVIQDSIHYSTTVVLVSYVTCIRSSLLLPYYDITVLLRVSVYYYIYDCFYFCFNFIKEISWIFFKKDYYNRSYVIKLRVITYYL